MIESKSSKNNRRQLLNLGFIFFLSLLTKFYWIPGESFSSQYWDDEKLWVHQMQSRTLIEQVFLRDTPGYFVPLPRILLWATSVTGLNPAMSLRVSIYLIQFICLLFAVRVFTDLPLRKSTNILFVLAMCTFYNEELNYLHNIGYLFFFPARYLLGSIIHARRIFLPFYYLIFILLLSKPIIAILLLVPIFVLAKKDSMKAFLRFVPPALIVVIYLLLYLLLPHGWETPFNNRPFTGIYLVLNSLWVFPAILFPVVFIGFFGLLHLYHFRLLADIIGFATSLSISAGLTKSRKVIYRVFAHSSRDDKELWILIIFGYVLSYSAVNSILITQFPLWTNVQPQWIWNRYTALLPYLVMILIYRLLGRFKFDWQIRFPIYILIQNILLQLLALNALRRFW